jgi:hypothetical protein
MQIEAAIEKCLKCGGPLWDNRADKKTPKSPDMKCRDKACAEPYWIGKPRPKSAGPGQPTPSYVKADKWTWETLQQTYHKCLAIAAKESTTFVNATKIPVTGADVVAMAACLFITASRDGVSEPQEAEEM